MKEVVALEDAVVLYHPVVGFADKGFEDGGCNVWVVKRAQGVANVVQQRTHHVLVITAVPQGARGGLQAMAVTVDGKAAIVTV